MPRIFDKTNVILVKVDENDLNSFVVDMDIDDVGNPLYRIDDLTKAIISVIPEYVFAQYEDPKIPQTDAVDRLREAAKAIYKVKEYDLMRKWHLDGDTDAFNQIKESKFINRGEFGELLLHLLLREFKHTIPLVSKVYFSDAPGVPSHGFDAVHISKDEKILWLGESKLYDDGKVGVSKLIQDIEDHIKADYLDEQLLIIKKNLKNNSIPQREEWLEVLSSCSRLKDKIDMINIPMLCTYSHDIYSKYRNMDEADAINYHNVNVRDLKKFFDKNNDHALKNSLNIILMLFPIKDKKEFVRNLHTRLWYMQSM